MRRILAVVVVLLIVSASARAGTSEESLRGLKGMSVAVSPISEAGRQLGLDQKTIQTKVELMLRRNGVPLIEASGATSESAPLLVTAEVVGGAFNVSVEVYQAALISRAPLIDQSVRTWSSGSFGIHRGNARHVHDQIEGAVERFALAWHKAARPTAKEPALSHELAANILTTRFIHLFHRVEGLHDATVSEKAEHARLRRTIEGVLVPGDHTPRRMALYVEASSALRELLSLTLHSAVGYHAAHGKTRDKAERDVLIAEWRETVRLIRKLDAMLSPLLFAPSLQDCGQSWYWQFNLAVWIRLSNLGVAPAHDPGADARARIQDRARRARDAPTANDIEWLKSEALRLQRVVDAGALKKLRSLKSPQLHPVALKMVQSLENSVEASKAAGQTEGQRLANLRVTVACLKGLSLFGRAVGWGEVPAILE